MPFNCSLASPGSHCSPDAPFSKFRVHSGKTYKLRLINSGANSLLGFSIDNHVLTIIANDFVALEPYNTTMVLLGVSLFELQCLRNSTDYIQRLVKGRMFSSRPRQMHPCGCGLNQSEDSVLDHAIQLRGLLFSWTMLRKNCCLQQLHGLRHLTMASAQM